MKALYLSVCDAVCGSGCVWTCAVGREEGSVLMEGHYATTRVGPLLW
jgi:hypothetical protein